MVEHAGEKLQADILALKEKLEKSENLLLEVESERLEIEYKKNQFSMDKAALYEDQQEMLSLYKRNFRLLQIQESSHRMNLKHRFIEIKKQEEENSKVVSQSKEITSVSMRMLEECLQLISELKQTQTTKMDFISSQVEKDLSTKRKMESLTGRTGLEDNHDDESEHPIGHYNDEIQKYLKAKGYEGSFSSKGDEEEEGENLLETKRRGFKLGKEGGGSRSKGEAATQKNGSKTEFSSGSEFKVLPKKEAERKEEYPTRGVDYMKGKSRESKGTQL